MKAIVLWAFLYLTWPLALVMAVEPPARYRAGCTILFYSKLYCFGGGRISIDANVNSYTAFNDHHMLDLTQSFAANASSSNWQKLPDPTDFTLQRVSGFAFTKLSESSYMINSGMSFENANAPVAVPIVNATLVYHADTGTWESIAKGQFFNQTSGSTIVKDQKGTLWFFGGLTVRIDKQKSSLSAARRRVRSLDYASTDEKKRRWKLEPYRVLESPSNISSYHAAAHIPQSNKIYYSGGFFPTEYPTNTIPPRTYCTVEPDYNIVSVRALDGKGMSDVDYRSMNETIVFDTTTQEWSIIMNKNTQGLPTPRLLHTLTYLPKQNKMILYGGYHGMYDGEEAVNDYCWLYDVQNDVWSAYCPDSVMGNNGAGARYGHSAILLKDRYLFIVFGMSAGSKYTSDVHVLDTDTWTWVNELPDDAFTPPAEQLGAPEIAGIVVGAVAAVSVLIVAACFCITKRRHNRRKQETKWERSEEYDDFITNEPDPRAQTPVPEDGTPPHLKRRSPPTMADAASYVGTSLYSLAGLPRHSTDHHSMSERYSGPIKPDDKVMTSINKPNQQATDNRYSGVIKPDHVPQGEAAASLPSRGTENGSLVIDQPTHLDPAAGIVKPDFYTSNAK